MFEGLHVHALAHLPAPASLSPQPARALAL